MKQLFATLIIGGFTTAYISVSDLKNTIPAKVKEWKKELSQPSIDSLPLSTTTIEKTKSAYSSAYSNISDNIDYVKDKSQDIIEEVKDTGEEYNNSIQPLLKKINTISDVITSTSTPCKDVKK